MLLQNLAVRGHGIHSWSQGEISLDPDGKVYPVFFLVIEDPLPLCCWNIL